MPEKDSPEKDDKIPSLWVQNTERPLKLSSGDRYFKDRFGNGLEKEDIKKNA